ncbi:MAG TPA: DUF3368 domain-containing protein [Nannocystaceae bacterium]|nr:DUF3368 domain-containing protein [Nannocystaceae bacterium]
MIVVSDASPLIYLGGLGQLELLERLFENVVIPRIVFDEVVAAGAGRTGAREVSAADWIRIVDAEPDGSLLDRLDRGEATAMPLAQRLGATLVVDDAAARRIAIERGLEVVGTLGVLLAAKRRGLVSAVAPFVKQLEELGLFMSVGLRREVLSLADEVT